MKINGMTATHIGLVGFIPPWEGEENDIFDDLWGTPDGKRYVERYIQADIVEYDWIKHGFIWRDKDINKAFKDIDEAMKKDNFSINETCNNNISLEELVPLLEELLTYDIGLGFDYAEE